MPDPDVSEASDTIEEPAWFDPKVFYAELRRAEREERS